MKPISSRSYIGPTSQRWAETNICSCVVEYLIVKFVLLLALRPTILCSIIELPDVFSPSVFGWRWTFFSLDKSSVATGRLELDVPAASSCPELDAPGVVLLTRWESCWHMFSRLYCVIVHVGNLTANFFSQSILSNELAFASRQPM